MQTMIILADTIKGEINRMCVTDDLSELDSMTLHATKNIEKLRKMKYDVDFAVRRVNNDL